MRFRRIELQSGQRSDAEVRLWARYPGRAPLVPMMHSADFRNGYDPSVVWHLDWSGHRTVFRESQMCAAVMVILLKAPEVPV